jgi:hypothetical protein
MTETSTLPASSNAQNGLGSSDGVADSSSHSSIRIRIPVLGSETQTRLDALSATLCARAASTAEEGVQAELAAFAALLPKLRGAHFEHLLPLAEIGVAAVTAVQPNLILGKNVRECLAEAIKTPRILRLIRTGTPTQRIILGLGVLLYLVIPLSMYIPINAWPDTIVGITTEELIVVALSGATGSIVSIMVRMRDFAGLPDSDPLLHFFTGLFKPVVGVAFDLFICVCPIHLCCPECGAVAGGYS